MYIKKQQKKSSFSDDVDQSLLYRCGLNVYAHTVAAGSTIGGE